MKANLPLAYQSGAAAHRMKMMNVFLIYAGFILFNDFDFEDKDLQRFVNRIAEFIRSEKHNDTLIDEAIAWAEKHGFMERVR